MTSSPTGLAIWYDPLHAEHDPGPGFPDRPPRIAACVEALGGAGWQVSSTDPIPAEKAELVFTHDEDYLEYLDRICKEGGGTIDGDTRVGPRSFEVASRAAGLCVEAAVKVCESSSPIFGLVRPPGHHASSDRAMGFCLLNNVAIAANAAIRRQLARRVMIVDLDVHHGNGTQDIFWSDPNVLYLSLHQWPWYPWIRGSLGEIGEGPGEGTTVNIPLPAMTGDDVYVEAFQRVVVPVVRQFNPDLLLMSAGFDAHSDDALSLQEVTPNGFGLMTTILMDAAREVCDGRVLGVLEGGYHLTGLAASVVESARALEPRRGPSVVPDLSEGLPYSEHALTKVIDFHSRRWNLGQT